MKIWSLQDKNDYLLDFIHLVYSPRGIQYFNIQPVSSKLVYFLITLVYVSVCVLNWRFVIKIQTYHQLHHHRDSSNNPVS